MGRSVDGTADLTEIQPPLYLVGVCGTGANTKCLARTKEKAVVNTGITAAQQNADFQPPPPSTALLLLSWSTY